MLLLVIAYSGANKEALDVKSLTPLLTAVSWNKLEAVKCLFELGAQIDAIDEDGKSGVFLAAKLNELPILKVLLFSVHMHVCVCTCVCFFVCMCLFVCVYSRLQKSFHQVHETLRTTHDTL